MHHYQYEFVDRDYPLAGGRLYVDGAIAYMDEDGSIRCTYPMILDAWGRAGFYSYFEVTIRVESMNGAPLGFSISPYQRVNVMEPDTHP